MNLLIQGTNAFNDYNVFMRAMAVALSDTKSELKITSIGGYRINQMVREFVNVSENGLRSRGVSIRLRLRRSRMLHPIDFGERCLWRRRR